jgi:hypothetical protein
MGLREYAGGAKRTSLVGDVTAGSTTLTVSDATGYPTGATGPFAIALSLGDAGEEKVLVASRSGNTLTVNTRGYDGTTAAAHASGSTVDHVLTATDIREANEFINGGASAAYQPLADQRIHVPASLMVASFGAPSLVGIGSSGDKAAVAWLLDAATHENVSAQTVIPAGWATVNVNFYWTNAGAGAGDVQWSLRVEGAFGHGDTLGSALSAPFTGASVAPAQNVVKGEQFATGLPVTPGKMFGLLMQRDGGNAADTLGNDAALIAVEIRRAS